MLRPVCRQRYGSSTHYTEYRYTIKALLCTDDGAMSARAAMMRSLQWVAFGGFSLSDQVHDLLDFPRRQRLAPGRAGGVLQQPVHPLGRVASPPASHGEHALAHPCRHLNRANAVTGQKHNPRPPYNL